MKKLLLPVIILISILTLSVNVKAEDIVLTKGRATVYSLNGKTALGTPVRSGVCATGDKELLGKTIIVYQRKPDETIGDVIGIYSVEDTGCKSGVIDIWCPVTMQKTIIDKTYENGCKGKIYIQIIGDIEG